MKENSGSQFTLLEENVSSLLRILLADFIMQAFLLNFPFCFVLREYNAFICSKDVDDLFSFLCYTFRSIGRYKNLLFFSSSLLC
jgi:hypothetical protein